MTSSSNQPSQRFENMYSHILPELEAMSKVFESKQNEFAEKKFKLLKECNVFDVNATRHD